MRIQFLWIALAMLLAGCQSESGLSGNWVLDKEQSTNVDSWRSIELRITANEDQVAIGRLFNPRRSARHDSVTVPTNDTQVEIPMTGSAKWLEQNHLGVFVDGKSWNHEIVELASDTTRVITIDLPELEEGSHTIEGMVSSRDEYSGVNGYLQRNNARSLEVEIEGERDDGLIAILLIVLVFLSVSFLLVLIFLRRKD